MDKNQATGVLLLLIVLLAYFMFNAPSEEEIARQQYVQDSIATATKLETSSQLPTTAPIPKTVQPSDSVAMANLKSQHGDFGAAMAGDNQQVTIENNLIAITFNSKGGSIAEAELKEHYKITENEEFEQSKALLKLMDDDKDKFEYLIPTRANGLISTAELNFTPAVTGQTVTMTAALPNGGSVVQKYVLADSSYNVDYALQLNGVNNLLDPSNNKLKFRWHHHLDRLEINTTFEKYYSTVYFKESNEDSDYCSCRADDKQTLDNKQIDWISHVNQFFNTSIIAKNKKFENAVFETVLLDDDNPDLKLIKSEYEIPLDLVANESIETKMYIGPNEFKRLNNYENGLEEIIPFGRSIFGSINRWIIRPAFNWLSGFIGSKGLVIIILIFIIKLILYPLMYKMLHSQAKMGLLKPEIAKLKEKFKDDSQKVQMETMKMYREYGVSPLGGCMPMILQMPIWYALFRFFPASITFRQESFLWANDLSSFDVVARLPFEIPAFGAHISLFTILWAISTILYSFYNMRHMDMSANPAMKYVQYFMPITFLFFFNTYASGLTCYMFFSNFFNVLQTVITKKFVFNDDKLRAQLTKQKNKPKKQGGFQQRLEEAMKQQQEIQKQKSNQAQSKKKKRK